MLSANDSMLLACDSKIISGFVFGKIKQAEISGLDIRLQISTSFKKARIPETVWIELIGILLDNALEASKQGDTIYLESCQAENVTELWVCNPHPPLSGTEFMHLFAKGVSTKVGNSRGYGLYQLMADHRTLSRQDSDPERNPEWSELCGVRRSVFMNMRYEQGFCGNEIRFIPTKTIFRFHRVVVRKRIAYNTRKQRRGRFQCFDL